MGEWFLNGKQHKIITCFGFTQFEADHGQGEDSKAMLAITYNVV